MTRCIDRAFCERGPREEVFDHVERVTRIKSGLFLHWDTLGVEKVAMDGECLSRELRAQLETVDLLEEVVGVGEGQIGSVADLMVGIKLV